MDYYTVKDIMEITGTSKSYSYRLIVDLNNQFREEHPEVLIIRGKIPKWYFEKKLMNKE